MIRKMIHMDVPTELLHDVLADSVAWPKWMPGMISSRIVTSGENSHVVLVKGTYAGIKFDQEMEVTVGRDFVKQVQRTGWPMKWGVTWRLIKPPAGTGSTVVAEVEATFATLAPKKMLLGMLRRMVGDMLIGCKKRVEGLHVDRRDQQSEIPTEDGDRILLAVYQTEKGLEVTVGDRTFVIDGNTGLKVERP